MGWGFPLESIGEISKKDRPSVTSNLNQPPGLTHSKAWPPREEKGTEEKGEEQGGGVQDGAVNGKMQLSSWVKIVK